jgi:hypothetical protein
LGHESIKSHLQFQMEYVNRFYNWNKIGHQWTKFLKGITDARRK